jgi:hypothetical protein
MDRMLWRWGRYGGVNAVRGVDSVEAWVLEKARTM